MITFLPEQIGGRWDRTAEIDVLAVSQAENAVLEGDFKWSANPVGNNILEVLMQESLVLVKVHGIQRFEYALFSRSGFTPALVKQAGREGIGLYGMEEILRSIM
jgi:uncharacterized protein